MAVREDTKRERERERGDLVYGRPRVDGDNDRILVRVVVRRI